MVTPEEIEAWEKALGDGIIASIFRECDVEWLITLRRGYDLSLPNVKRGAKGELIVLWRKNPRFMCLALYKGGDVAWKYEDTENGVEEGSTDLGRELPMRFYELLECFHAASSH